MLGDLCSAGVKRDQGEVGTHTHSCCPSLAVRIHDACGDQDSGMALVPLPFNIYLHIIYVLSNYTCELALKV